MVVVRVTKVMVGSGSRGPIRGRGPRPSNQNRMEKGMRGVVKRNPLRQSLIWKQLLKSIIIIFQFPTVPIHYQYSISIYHRAGYF